MPRKPESLPDTTGILAHYRDADPADANATVKRMDS